MSKVAIVTPFSTFPGELVDFSALAEYSLNLLNVLPADTRSDIVILSQKGKKNKPYKIGNTTVHQVWDRNKPYYIFQVISFILKNRLKIVHLQHEVYAYGENVYLYPYLFNLMVLILRILGRKVIVTIHGVVPFESLGDSFLKNNKVSKSPFLVRVGLFLLYYPLVSFSDVSIVHNDKIRSYLLSDYRVSKNKLVTIPLPLFKFKPNQIKAKFLENNFDKKDKIVLFFGFLAPYKGLDILVKSFKYIDFNSGIKVLIAGSKPKRLSSSDEYNKWLDNLVIETKKYNNVFWNIDLIPDEELDDYFEKIGLLVLPYKECLSSSGAITYAILKLKPVLVSDSFKGVVEDALLFKNSPHDLATKINKFFANERYKEKLVEAVTRQKNLFSDDVISKKTASIYLKYDRW